MLLLAAVCAVAAGPALLTPPDAAPAGRPPAAWAGPAPHADGAPAAAPAPGPAAAPAAPAASSSPRFLDAGGLPAPRVRAAAALVYNPATDEVVWASGGFDRRPIASITKVMTALVALAQAPDLSGDVVVSGRDVARASTTYLRRGERMTLDGLLHLALIASDNVAARLLARASGLGTRRFVAEMNRTAAALGLTGTQFVEPSGLDERNVSTPYDVARLIAQATRTPALARIMRIESHRLRTDRRRLAIRNTNWLLRGQYAVHGGKTGYIDEAGYCLAAVVKVPGADRLAVVVLGAGSNAARFREARRLVDWVSTTGQPLLAPALGGD